jgi:phosphoserine phosphatase RsbU/P
LRRRMLGIAAIVILGAMQLAAQAPHLNAKTPIEVLLPHSHAGAVPANPQHAPEAIFDATGIGSPVLLDKGWRVGITGNPAAAAADFDDSAWPIRDAIESFADVPDEDHPADASGTSSARPAGHHRPYAWFRLHIKLAANHGPISLLVELPFTPNHSFDPSTHALAAMEVYANGHQLQPEGEHPDDPQFYEPISRIYNLNLAPSETSLTLAVRIIYIPTGQGAYTNFFSNRSLLMGHPADLARELSIWSAHRLFERLPRLIYSFLLVALTLFLLTLYFTQKGHREYIWLALYEAIQAPSAFIELAGSSARIDQLWYFGITLQLIVISAYLYFEFLIAFLSLRKRWAIRLFRYSAPVLAAVGPSLLMLGHNPSRTTGFVLAIFWLISLLWMTGWLIFIFFTLIVATLRRNFEAGLLLIPLVLSVVGIAELALTGGMIDLGGGTYHSPLTLQAGPIPIHFSSIADLTGIIAIVLIIFVRFLRVQRDQERASNELAAARSVQELMIPQEKVETPGYEVDSVYNPANEVGGDFFHLQSTSDGGLLVVIGDVAGKGLQAAMNVSMLMGALRSTRERSPAKILELLNRVLVGSDSFTTCQAAWFGPSGELVLANAGHLPPYLNSQEVALPGGLPLGVLASVSYPEVRLYLHPGDRILLLSDGVVEARLPSGELFGFDRVHNLSNQTAFYIADAAKEFGQEDDITVLTIRRTAEGIVAA